ncbi:MAG: PKD domain-containing protein [Bacteroidia bacterium]
MKIYSFVLLLIALLSGCRENDLPQPQNGDPVFFVKGMINGNQMEITAGEHDYYMFTSHGRDTHQVISFTGEFRKLNCSSNCPGTLTITIRDKQAGGLLDIEQALAPGDYPFRSPLPSYVVQFMADTLKMGQGYYNWDFGDNTFSQEASPLHVFNIVDPQRQVFPVTLTITNSVGCISSITNIIDFANRNCHTYFDHDPPNSSIVSFFSYPTGSDPVRHVWSVGGTVFSNDPNPVHDFRQPGVYEVTLEVMDSINCLSTYSRNVNVLTQNCAANFTYTLLNAPDFSKVTITWIDENGKIYSSGIRAQPAQSYFRVLNSEKYEINENQQPTMKLSVQFDGWLYSDTDSIKFEDFSGEIGVAYP